MAPVTLATRADEAGGPPSKFHEISDNLGEYHGHAGIRRWWESLFPSLPDFTIEVVEVRDLGDVTIAVLRNRAHGAISATPVEQRLWIVGKWREGKVVWWQTFPTEAEALEAVGPAR